MEKAYDKVDRGKLWEVMAKYGIEGGLLNVVRALYDGYSAKVRIKVKPGIQNTLVF